MAADTATTSLGLLLMGTGNNDNIWGDLFNAQVIQYIEDALVGRTAKSTTGGATTLTQAECRPRYLDFSGTLASDATITVPNTKNGWIITNSTTGNFGLLIKTSGGTATGVPQGTSKEVFCDGSNGVYRTDREQVGRFFFHAGLTPPYGAFECTGAAKLRASYPDLYAVVGTIWGAGNGTTDFIVPDAYTAGKFLRSRSGTIPLGAVQTDQNKAHAHTGSTVATVASGLTATATSGGAHTHTGTTDSDGVDHTHTYDKAHNVNNANGVSTLGSVNSFDSTASGGASAYLHTHAFTTASGGAHTHAVDFTGSTITSTPTIASDGGTEARPTNISAILCVWY